MSLGKAEPFYFMAPLIISTQCILLSTLCNIATQCRRYSKRSEEALKQAKLFARKTDLVLQQIKGNFKIFVFMSYKKTYKVSSVFISVAHNNF